VLSDTIIHTEDMLVKGKKIPFLLALKVIMVAIEHMRHPRVLGKVCVHFFSLYPNPSW